MSELADQAAQEVRSLHATFCELFAGRSQNFDRCARALARDFCMITPDGLLLDRATVLDRLVAMRAPPGFLIAISDIRLVAEFGDSVLLRYVEEQYREANRTRRLSTALFTAEAKAPCGVVWRYLQETCIRNVERY